MDKASRDARKVNAGVEDRVQARKAIRHRASTALASLDDLERYAATLDTSPGWIARSEPIFWSEPRSAFRPAHWRYSEIRAALDDASRLVDLSLAERRILALRNPFPGNNFATTRTLSCSYQYMLPGEVAATHRHASHALRVMLDAAGTYSIVDGVRMPMETGDVVLTPGGSWHGHGHEGDQPACWLDGLDIPLTHLLEPMYFEPHPDRHMPATRCTEISPLRFSAGDVARLLDLAVADPDGLHGPRAVLPAPAMPSMGLAVERLAAGERTRRQRTTASRCFIVMSGSGTSKIGDESFDWEAGDTMAVPTWIWWEHQAAADTQLFELSDEPVMRMCNYFRREIA
jgi:gentisate 1,2-dioxygenase